MSRNEYHYIAASLWANKTDFEAWKVNVIRAIIIANPPGFCDTWLQFLDRKVTLSEFAGEAKLPYPSDSSAGLTTGASREAVLAGHDLDKSVDRRASPAFIRYEFINQVLKAHIGLCLDDQARATLPTSSDVSPADIMAWVERKMREHKQIFQQARQFKHRDDLAFCKCVQCAIKRGNTMRQHGASASLAPQSQSQGGHSPSGQSPHSQGQSPQPSPSSSLPGVAAGMTGLNGMPGLNALNGGGVSPATPPTGAVDSHLDPTAGAAAYLNGSAALRPNGSR